MRFCCLGSGSKGNATLVELGSSYFMIDCGFSIKYIEKAFQDRGLDINQLKAILVTHEHSDHASGVAPLARRYQLPVYASAGTYRSGKVSNIPYAQVLSQGETFELNCAVAEEKSKVEPVAVPHDALEAC